MHVAIIGAGMAGLACAMRLSEAGHAVSLFDKGRGPGGRMATRRMEAGGRTVHFDHGAQYFTAHDPVFARQVEAWERDGIAARWPAAGSETWVGTPGMNAPVRAMAERLGVSFSSRVESIRRVGPLWTLDGDNVPDAAFDAVVVAVPAEQAGALLMQHDGAMAELADATVSEPCWTLMIAFESPLEGAPDTIRDHGAIGWAARNASKPQRGDTECWVIQANSEWSAAHLEEEGEAIGPLLHDALAGAAGAPLPSVLAMSAHRWRYARSGKAGPGHLWAAEKRLGVCGHWLIAPRVEAAYLSGYSLAGTMLGQST